MNAGTMTPVLRVLRWCLHALMTGLLALAALRAVADDSPRAPAVVALCAVTVAVYAAGALSPRVQRSASEAAAWLALLCLLWAVLLVVTPDALWAAFPLFFLQMHVLPLRWALPAVALTTAAAIAGFVLHDGAASPGVFLGPPLGAAVAVATVLGYNTLYRESEERRRLIEELLATRAELADAERAAGTLAERERLAREIHDTLAQGLSSIQLLLRAAERALPADAAALAHVREARVSAQDNLAEARRFVRELTPPDLEHGSLAAALERLCASVPERPAVRCAVSGTPVELPTPYEVALLRVAQSALANAVRHANADQVSITLSYLGTSVALDVVDDGSGFDPDSGPQPSSSGGFGLPAMRSRAHALGGTLSVESAPGQGTAVAITLPLAERGPVEPTSARSEA